MPSNKRSTKRTHAQKRSSPEDGQWLSPKVITLLAIVFIATQVIGLVVAHELHAAGIQESLFSENIDDASNALYLLGTILVMTAIIVVLVRMRKANKFLWIIEFLAVASTSIIVFSSIFPKSDSVALALTILLLGARYIKRKNVNIRTITSIIAVAGAGAIIGISIGVLPAVIFIVLLAIYDIIAVYYTKHMVEIGKEVTKNNFAFTVALPTKKHSFELGNGDLVIPLIVASSILTNGAFANNSLVASLCLAASFAGLAYSIYSVSVKKHPLPALPPQTALMVAVLIAAVLLGL